MTSLFKQQLHKTGKSNNTQAFYREQGYDPRFHVGIQGDAKDGFEVLIWDDAAIGNFDAKLIYVMHFSTETAADAVHKAMEQEIEQWDCDEYYLGEDPRAEYERTEMSVLAASQEFLSC